jgi:hypothetical protein
LLVRPTDAAAGEIQLGRGSQQHKDNPASQDDAVETIPTAFPVSDAIERSCASLEALPTGSCRDLYSAIDRLRVEERDDSWATGSEAKITQLISRSGASVRKLECRRTICAIEVESAQGVFRVRSAELPRDLIELDHNFGYELDAKSNRITVTLIVLERL